MKKGALAHFLNTAEPAIDRMTPVAALPEILRVGEVSAKLDCSEGLVYELIRCNQLASIRLGRLLRVPRSSLEKFLDGAK